MTKLPLTVGGSPRTTNAMKNPEIMRKAGTENSGNCCAAMSNQ
ncbi:MAG: hypothetical protein M5R40_29770 [Anaerolineae bacterium]|nr:hypothetical protein [Anaerolineae bacterium]